jgi:thiol-disulfide isomerase/thioredoxin
MAGMAIAAILLMIVVIYSLSQLKQTVWTRTLGQVALDAKEKRPAPEFNFKDGEQSLQSADLLGHWTLLSFWAHWCAPCLEELPTLNQLGDQWQNASLQIITVNIDDPKTESFESARRFLTDNEVTLPTLFDRDAFIQKAFAVKDVPQHFLINPEGQIVWQAVGALQWNDARAREELMRVMGDDVYTEGSDPDGYEEPMDSMSPEPAPQDSNSEPAK